MDGGDENRMGTSNASCEKIMKMHSEEARKRGKKMIFISSIMGTRSWSNKYVKNVLLLFDCGSFDAPEIIQTVTKTIERTIRYKNGKPVSCKEKYDETSTTRRLNNPNFIETIIVE